MSTNSTSREKRGVMCKSGGKLDGKWECLEQKHSSVNGCRLSVAMGFRVSDNPGQR